MPKLMPELSKYDKNGSQNSLKIDEKSRLRRGCVLGAFLEGLWAPRGARTEHVKVHFGDRFPSKIGKINSTVLGLERSRAAMKRSMIKTRQEIRIVQYSVICALLAERFNGTPIAALLVVIAIWITFRKDRSL